MVAAELLWTQHGGSGTNLTLSDVVELEWEHARWWLDWIKRRRQTEKDALEAAHKAGSRKGR